MRSVFFGGGTPSLMEARTVEHVLQTITRFWPLAADVEITLEANPTSSEAEKFAAFRAAGVNRLSLGVQSFRDDALKFLGRAHDVAEARRAIALAARHFPRFSFDLIYARHGQTPKAWESELREALSFGARHMSLYQLTIESGTAFYALAKKEPLQAPDDTAATMYEMTQELMENAGLPAYEISNHAAPHEASRHNLTYWHYDDYVGIGPGAHGRCVWGGTRFALENHRAPETWLEQVAKRGQGQSLATPLDNATAQREALMMGLRLKEGLNAAAWHEKFGTPLAAILSSERLERLRREKLILLDNTGLHATPEGLQRLNGLLSYLLYTPST